jgi:hypothetical protein
MPPYDPRQATQTFIDLFFANHAISEHQSVRSGRAFRERVKRRYFDADFRSACGNDASADRRQQRRRQMQARLASHGLQLFAAVVRQGAKQLATASTIDRSRLSNVAGHVTFVDEYCERLLCEHGPMPVGDPLGFDEGRLRPFGDNDKAEPDLGKQTF